MNSSPPEPNLSAVSAGLCCLPQGLGHEAATKPLSPRPPFFLGPCPNKSSSELRACEAEGFAKCSRPCFRVCVHLGPAPTPEGPSPRRAATASGHERVRWTSRGTRLRPHPRSESSSEKPWLPPTQESQVSLPRGSRGQEKSGSEAHTSSPLRDGSLSLAPGRGAGACRELLPAPTFRAAAP